MKVSEPKRPAAMWDAVQIAPEDHVAVAVRDLQGPVDVLAGDQRIQCVLPSRIPMGHKFALADISAGTEIRKYGQVIGVLSRPVAVGEHIHIHNLASQRAKSS
jgi:altronate dehydratase small subunit